LEEVDNGTFLVKLRETPFYAAGGGQVTDTGWIELDDDPAVRADLAEAYRIGDDQVLLLRGGGFAAGDRVKAIVAWRARFPTMANHTATHLMHQALRDVLGDHVKQAGSAVRPDKLRFDFTHDQPLTAEQRQEVERRVNEKIFENLPVVTFETPIEEARTLGAMMLFGEKYGDIVRVVQIPGYSTELCGGTHVRSTAEIGAFAILSESSVGSGARRIEAVTSGEAYAYLHARSRELDDVRGAIEELRRQLRRKPEAVVVSVDPEARIVEQDGVNVVVQRVDGFAGDALLELSDRLKQRHAPAAVVLGAVDGDRVQLVANFDSAVAQRVAAGDVIKGAAAIVGGSGGGRPTMARAGGKDPARLGDALAEAERLITAAL
jgi:alanyl-tRNA synthetase